MQPIILAVGSDWTSVNEFYVKIDTLSYRFENILKAIDTVFKIYHVLDLCYAKESYLVWLFIQRFIYNIHLKSDKVSQALSTFISDIESSN